MFAQALENHSPGGSVDPHGKGLSGEQHLDEAPAKQHLHHLFHDRQQPCMQRGESNRDDVYAFYKARQQPCMQRGESNIDTVYALYDGRQQPCMQRGESSTDAVYGFYEGRQQPCAKKITLLLCIL